MLNRLSVRVDLFCLTTACDVGIGMYNGFDWYGRILEVREVWLAFTLHGYHDSQILCLGSLCGLVRPWRLPR